MPVGAIAAVAASRRRNKKRSAPNVVVRDVESKAQTEWFSLPQKTRVETAEKYKTIWHTLSWELKLEATKRDCTAVCEPSLTMDGESLDNDATEIELNHPSHAAVEISVHPLAVDRSTISKSFSNVLVSLAVIDTMACIGSFLFIVLSNCNSKSKTLMGIYLGFCILVTAGTFYFQKKYKNHGSNYFFKELVICYLFLSVMGVIFMLFSERCFISVCVAVIAYPLIGCLIILISWWFKEQKVKSHSKQQHVSADMEDIVDS